jgi:transposase
MSSQITLPLEIPDVEVAKTECTPGGDYIIVVTSTVKGTTCRKCGRQIEKFHGHDRWIKLRHLPILGHQVYIMLRPKRYECPYCLDRPTTTQCLDWYNPNNSLTKAYEDFLLLQLVNSTVQDVSRKEGVSYDMVRGVVTQRIRRTVDWSTLTHLDTLGIDEIALHKGRSNYAAIISARQMDGRVIILTILGSRTKAAVKDFLQSIPEHLRATVDSVCTDMWEGYVNAAREVFGDRVHIVIDRFHVAKSYREGADKLRKQECKRLKKELPDDEYKQLKGVMWAFRKNKSDLSEEGQELLDRLFAYSLDLKSAYDLRENLTAIFESQLSKSQATERLIQWQQAVRDSGLRCFDSFLTTLNNWSDEITNYFHKRLNSGFVEGLNNKLKTIKRRCYGLLRPDHLFQRLFLDLEGYRLFGPNAP